MHFFNVPIRKHRTPIRLTPLYDKVCAVAKRKEKKKKGIVTTNGNYC